MHSQNVIYLILCAVCAATVTVHHANPWGKIDPFTDRLHRRFLTQLALRILWTLTSAALVLASIWFGMTGGDRNPNMMIAAGIFGFVVGLLLVAYLRSPRRR